MVCNPYFSNDVYYCITLPYLQNIFIPFLCLFLLQISNKNLWMRTSLIIHSACNVIVNVLFHTILLWIYVLLSVKVSGLKMCQCKKMDKYKVWFWTAKKGPKNSGRGLPPLFGKCPKENIFLWEVFPYIICITIAFQSMHCKGQLSDNIKYLAGEIQGGIRRGSY